MEEGTGRWVLNILVAVVVLIMILVLASMFFSSEQQQEGIKTVSNVPSRLTVMYVPGTGKITNPLSPPGPSDSDAVSINEPVAATDGYAYHIKLLPSLKIGGEGEDDVTAIVEFKGKSARAKDYRTGSGKDYFHITAGTTDQPDLEADIITPIPPITDYSTPLCSRQSVLVKSQTGAPLIVTTTVKSRLNDVAFLNRLPDAVQNYFSCSAFFRFDCEDDAKYTGWMAGCDTSDPTDCEENIEICGGSVHIKLLDEPDCDSGKVEALVSYDGQRQFTVNELVSIYFWKKSDCTMNNDDINIIWGTCNRSYYMGAAKNLKAGMIKFGGTACG